MSSYWAVAWLFLATGTLFFLPLVPAMWEFYRKTDASALSVIQQHSGDVRYFADSFRTYLKGLDPTLQQCSTSGRPTMGTMPDGTDYLVLGSGDQAYQLPLGEKGQHCPMLIAAASDLLLPSDAKFSKDIYSRGRFLGGSNNSYRAILADQAAHLGENSSVTRWIHAVGEFSAAEGCKLYGRVSSENVIRLEGGCQFTRLNAPTIEIGDRPPANLPASAVSPGRSAWDLTTRILHEGDFEIRAGDTFQGSMVVRGKLHIGAGARVFGNVKSEKDAVLDSGARVEGSLISAKRLLIGRDCRIHGPVIAEREVIVASGTCLGTPESLTTVSAPQIKVEEGVIVFGTLWAREHGEVVTRS